MSVFRSIVFAAAIAGLAAGVVVSVAQHFGTVPLILKAEVYERAAEADEAAAPAVSPGAAAHNHADHDHAAADAAAWEPAEGFQRNAFTVLANVLTGAGFALVLAGIFSLRGRPVGWHEGLLWGLGGFAALTVAPGLGLPPELPGVPAAALEARQIWWVATAAATAGGLALIALLRAPWAAVLGVVLIALPHVIGAPQLEDMHTNVPESLSHRFVVAVTVTSLLFWTVLGSLTAAAYQWFSASEGRTPAAAKLRAEAGRAE